MNEASMVVVESVVCAEGPRVFEVPSSRLSELESKLARLTRRAAKLGVPAPALMVLGTHMRLLPRRTGEGGVEEYGAARYLEIVRLTVTGEAPKFAGWTFLARLERLSGASGNILHTAGHSLGLELPESYRTAPPRCDHCKLDRKRKDTFVVRHEDGRTLQVGSSCLADFLGHQHPEALAGQCEALFSLVSACADEEREGWGYSGAGNAFGLAEYLSWVHAAITTAGGWVSRSRAYESGGTLRSTSEIAWTWMIMRDSERRSLGIESPTEEALERANAAILWAQALTPTNDYLHNLKTIAGATAISERSSGLAASILPSFDRHLAREAEIKIRAARPRKDEYVGAVGERLRDLRLECTRVGDFSNEWGARYLICFEDAEGRAYKWWATSGRLDTGTLYTVTGTVKKHETYKGRKETVLTRCDAETDEEKADREARAEKAAEEARAAKAAWKALTKAMKARGEIVELRVSELCVGMATFVSEADVNLVTEIRMLPNGKIEVKRGDDYYGGRASYKPEAKVFVRVQGPAVEEVE